MCCAFINLVSHNYEFLVCHTLLDVLYLGFGGLLVDKPKHNLRLLQLLVGALDADVLDNVIGWADAAVSTKRNWMPLMMVVSSMKSRVVPCTSLTMAFSSCSRWLSRVLFPTLVFPTMATGIPFFKALPTSNERASEQDVGGCRRQGCRVRSGRQTRVLRGRRNRVRVLRAM